MIEWWDYWTDGYDPPSGGSGMATTLPIEHQDDKVAALHAIVEEVTGKPVAVPPRPRIGFV